jgi:hypothetical protein
VGGRGSGAGVEAAHNVPVRLVATARDEGTGRVTSIHGAGKHVALLLTRVPEVSVVCTCPP